MERKCKKFTLGPQWSILLPKNRSIHIASHSALSRSYTACTALHVNHSPLGEGCEMSIKGINNT